jgi:hypothetical protein
MCVCVYVCVCVCVGGGGLCVCTHGCMCLCVSYICILLQVQLRHAEVKPLHLAPGSRRVDADQRPLDVSSQDVAPLRRGGARRVRGQRRHLRRDRRHEPLPYRRH